MLSATEITAAIVAVGGSPLPNATPIRIAFHMPIDGDTRSKHYCYIICSASNGCEVVVDRLSHAKLPADATVSDITATILLLVTKANEREERRITKAKTQGEVATQIRSGLKLFGITDASVAAMTNEIKITVGKNSHLKLRTSLKQIPKTLEMLRGIIATLERMED